jgi:hypothetical protein
VTGSSGERAGHGGGSQAILDGYHTALIVPVVVSIAGLAVTLLGLRSQPAVPGHIGPTHE